MTNAARETRLVEALVTLADTLVVGYDLVELLHYLVETTVSVLDVAAAGLLLDDGSGHPDLLASTSERSELVELMQVHSQRGPCLECFNTGRTRSVPDLAQHRNDWPEFVELAMAQGFRSVHAFPMRLRQQTIGAMNLFGTEVGALSELDLRAAQALADVATIGILQERTVREGSELNERLQQALNSRVVIEQAKGLLSQHAGITMDQAFTAMRDFARSHQLKLTQLAQELIDRRRPSTDVLAAGTVQVTVPRPGPRRQQPPRTS